MTSKVAPGPDPLVRVAEWLDEARARGIAEPEAMALATADEGGIPSVRMVLCRGIDATGLRFFTNYESRKARDIEVNPNAALLFFWAPLQRQVRVEGTLEKLGGEESDAYFQSRPRGHRLGAWASPQSRPLGGRDELIARVVEVESRFAGVEVPRPPFWGGYRMIPRTFEFWTGGADRLHEREVYVRGADGSWSISLLAP